MSSNDGRTPRRILVVTFGSHGDVHPFLALARGLARRGHDVTFFTAAPFGDLVRRYGLDFVPIGSVDDFEAIQDDADLWHPRRAFPAIARALMKGFEESFDAVRARVEPGRTVLVGSTLAFAARVVREVTGAPMATVHLAPAVFRSEYRPPALPGLWLPAGLPRWWKRFVWYAADRLVIDRFLAPTINRLRARHDLAPVTRVFDAWMHSPDRVIALFPEWYRAPEPDWPAQTRLTGFPLFDESDGERLPPPEVTEFLDAGPAPVIFTAGSANRHAESFFAESVAACERLGRRGLLLTQHRPDVPSALPESVRHFDYVPFSQVLPRAAALVHHGGIGTTAQALRAGTPQLIRPLAHDQFDNAAILQDLGVGGSILPKHYAAPRVADALRALIENPEVVRAVEVARDRFADHDALGETCRLIETLPTM